MHTGAHARPAPPFFRTWQGARRSFAPEPAAAARRSFCRDNYIVIRSIHKAVVFFFFNQRVRTKGKAKGKGQRKKDIETETDGEEPGRRGGTINLL